MRQSLDQKSNFFDAMQQNFTLLEAMTEHQSKELKLLKKQNVKLKATYQKQNQELKKLQKDYSTINEEVIYLRGKDAVFKEADKQTQFYDEKILNLQAEIERQTAEIKELDFKYMNVFAENKVLKNDVVDVDSNLYEARNELKIL